MSELEGVHDTVYVSWDLTLAEALQVLAVLQNWGDIELEELMIELERLYWEALKDARRRER